MVTVTEKENQLYMKEKGKRGRPPKFSKNVMAQLKATYSGERAGNRHLQNHLYQSYSFGTILDYHKENPIENFQFLYCDNTYFKQTVFTELGRTNEFLMQYYNKEYADEYIINLAKELCLSAKQHGMTSRIAEKLIREDRKELKARLCN